MPLSYKVIVLSLVLFLLVFQVNAKSHQTYFFEKVGTEEEIPSVGILDLHEDKDGLLWLATQAGLVRYDGYQFLRFFPEPHKPDSLKDELVYMIAEDSQERLYLGHHSNGFSVFNKKNSQFTHYNTNTKIKTSHNKVYSIVPLHTQEILIATSGSIDIFNPEKEIITSFMPKGVQTFKPRSATLDITDKNIVWIATKKALWKFNIFDKSFALNTTFSVDLGTRYIKQISNNEIWLTTYLEGVYRVNITKKQITPLLKSANYVLDILQVNQDEFWLMSHDTGVLRINSAGQQLDILTATPFDDHSISHNQVSSAIKLKSGVIFVGTWGYGLNRHTPNNTLLNSYFLGPNNSFPFSVISLEEFQEEKLLLGTNKGVAILDLKSGKYLNSANFFKADSLMNEARVFGFLKLDSNTMWIATSKGLFEYKINSRELTYHLLAPKQYGIPMALGLSTVPDTLILRSTSHIYLYNMKTKEITDITKIDDSGKKMAVGVPKAMYTSKYGNTFINSKVALWYLPKGESELKNINVPAHLIGELKSMSEYNDELWLTTEKGFYRIDEQKLKQPVLNSGRFSFANNIAPNTGNFHFDKQGRLWSASYLIDHKIKKVYELDKKNGVDLGANWTGSKLKMKDGRIAFGGSKGVLIISPGNHTPNTYRPKVVLTNHWLNGKQGLAPYEDNLSVENFKSIRFEFSALDYAAPTKISYQYKLEGYDTDWQASTAKNRLASYTNLAPGTYTLKVKSTNREGDWGAVTDLAKLNVLPKYYQTWWFKLIVLSIFLFFFYKIIQHRLSLKFKTQQKKSEQRLALERAEMMAELVVKKDKLLADVSHELRTPLTVLKLQIESLQHNLEDDVQASYQEIDNKLTDIGTLINDIYQLAQSDIGALKLQLSNEDISTLLNTWQTEFQLLVNNHALTYQFDNQLRHSVNLVLDTSRVKQVLTNLLHNSCSYTDAPGKILMTLSSDENSVYLSIEDSSPSVPVEEQDLIFERLYRVEQSRSRATGGSGLGLAICRSIIEAHNSLITAKPSPLGGLKIQITIPKIKID